MNNHLTLFSQIRIDSKFRFETADSGKVFIKSSEDGARHDGAYQPVNPGVLVFPVPNPVVIAEFTTRQGNEWIAVRTDRNNWYLTPKYGDDEGSHFNSLEDITKHLGS